jgi:hypothetical protein
MDIRNANNIQLLARPHEPRTRAAQAGDALGAAPEVGVMAKRPQGLLNVGDSFRADGGAAFLRS